MTGVPSAPTANSGTSNTQIATTAFVSSAVNTASEGLHVLSACRLATTSQLSNYSNNTFTSVNYQIDNTSLSNDDRVLVKDQSTLSQNGIYKYVIASNVLSRVSDYTTNSIAKAGDFVFVTEGSINGS